MTKKSLLLILVAVVLATVYVIWFTDWFRPQTVRISYTSRHMRPNYRRGGLGMPNVIFRVNSVRFTELKVVPLDAYQTNHDVVPLWHLVSDSNSMPVKIFFYGQNIRGMYPAVRGTRPQPLETNVIYRMMVTAGKIKGQHDFELK